MSVELPLDSQQWPLFRLFVRKVSKGTVDPWRLLPGFGRGLQSRIDAFHVISLSRETIGKVGQLIFRVRFGVIDDIPTNQEPEDLLGYEVRCLVAEVTEEQIATLWDANEQNLNLTWYDCWHGWIEAQRDKLAPGANKLLGERFYYAYDASHHLGTWPLRRHGAICNGQTYNDCEGHPGYNTPGPSGDGTILGNRDPLGSGWDPNGDAVLSKCHRFTRPSKTVAGLFRDLDIVEQVLNVYRGKGDPVYAVAGTTSLLNGTSSIVRVTDATSAADVIDTLCCRQRGRGVAFWDFDLAPITSDEPPAMNHRLQVNPQVYDDITYTVPGGSSGSMNGALHARTNIRVDLEGDHRNIADHFLLGDRHENQVEYLESVGEKIQALGTFSVVAGGNADRRWSDTEQTNLLALAVDKRRDQVWQNVYHLFGLNTKWDGRGDHGNGAGGSRLDYRCSDSGQIITPSGAADTSPLNVRFLTTIPLYEGYDYSGSAPARRFGAPETAQPSRRQPMILVRSANDKFYDGRYDYGLTMAIHGDQFFVAHPSDDGTRVIGDPAQSSLASSWKWDRLVLVAALELPHRVRMASGDPNATRKLRINHRGVHLWVASPGIYDFNGAARNTDGTFPVFTGACAANKGILRDDRETLAIVHVLAVAWYGPFTGKPADQITRRVARWSLKACGFLPSFISIVDGDAETVQYPRLGQFVTTLTAGGKIWDINTPITSISYDNINGITTWSTDWSELDFAEVR